MKKFISVIAIPFLPVQITAVAEESANIMLETVSAKPGESVDDCGLFLGASFTASDDISMIPFRVMWENGLLTRNYTDNVNLAMFHFDVLDEASYGTSEIKDNGFVNTFLYDEENNLLDTYIIDPYYGIEISENRYGVELPQTGNNSTKSIAGAVFLLAMMMSGAFAMAESGVIGRKRKDEDEEDE